MQAGSTNRYKIGKSEDVDRRLKQNQTGCPDKLDVTYSAKFPEMAVNTVERSLHYFLSPYSTDGGTEWFELDRNMVHEVCNIIFSMAKVYPSKGRKNNPSYFKKNEKSKDFYPYKNRPEYLEKRKGWHDWKKRAKAVGIPLLPNHRPSRKQKRDWKGQIESREAFLGLETPHANNTHTNNPDTPDMIGERKAKREDYNRQQRGWYNWKIRAKAVGILSLPNKRPTKPQRKAWEHSIIAEERNLDIYKKGRAECNQLKIL